MAILLAICILSAGCTGSTEELDMFHGDDLDGDDPEYEVEEFSLIAPDGNFTNLSDYEGQVLVVSFI